MITRSEMYRAIKRALKGASYRDTSMIYFFLVCAGLVKEAEHERKD